MAILVLDSRDRIIDMNGAIKKNLSLYRPEIMGSNIVSVLPNEKNNGRIWVESTLRKGSKFYFEIPNSKEES